MKNLIWISTLLASLLFFGCSPNQNSGTVGATASTNSVCPTGAWYSNGQCYSSTGVTQSNASLNSGFYADNYSGTTSLRIINVSKMKEFFKLGMGVCDRAANNYGQASCDAYISGYVDLILQFPTGDGSQALATIIARPAQSSSYYNYYAQIPSGWGLIGAALGYLTGTYIPDPTYYNGPYRDPLQVQMTVSPTNNNQGFQASGYADAWTGLAPQTVITVQVLNGSTSSSSTLNYNFAIGSTVAVQGTMSRCQKVNCGL